MATCKSLVSVLGHAILTYFSSTCNYSVATHTINLLQSSVATTVLFSKLQENWRCPSASARGSLGKEATRNIDLLSSRARITGAAKEEAVSFSWVQLSSRSRVEITEGVSTAYFVAFYILFQVWCLSPNSSH